MAIGNESGEYYYSTDIENEHKETESSLETYYSNKPFNRSEFIKSVDNRGRLKALRIVGGFLAFCLLWDFIKIYRANYEYEIDNYVWTCAGLALTIIVVEVLIQMFAHVYLAVGELILVFILLFSCLYTTLMGLFLQPVGFTSLIFSAIHIEQCATFERKWKLYKIANSTENRDSNILL